MHKFLYFTLATLWLFTTEVHAAAPQSSYDIKVSMDHSTSDLTIQIQDTVESANDCDYYVHRFEFIESIKTLILDLTTENCPIDRWGKRKGKFLWNLPPSIRESGKICLIVNQKKLGATVIGHEGIEFRADQPNSHEVCE